MSNEERMIEVLDAVRQALGETVRRRRDRMPPVPFAELVTQFGAHRGVTAEEARQVVGTPLCELFALPAATPPRPRRDATEAGVRMAPLRDNYTTPWTRDEATGLLFRLTGGRLQQALPDGDTDRPADDTARDAYYDAAFGAGEVPAAKLDEIARGLRSLFVKLWRTRPRVTAVVVPREDLGVPAYSVTAALLDGTEDPPWPRPAVTFDRLRDADPNAPDPDLVFGLIRLAATSWKRGEPDDDGEAFDFNALTEALNAGEPPPPGLVEALQAHGILHLDFNFDYTQQGDWDDSLELTLNEEDPLEELLATTTPP